LAPTAALAQYGQFEPSQLPGYEAVPYDAGQRALENSPPHDSDWTTPQATSSGYFSDEGYTHQLLPEGLIYRSYLAGAKESRFRSFWAHEKDQGWLWDIALGGRVGLYRYGNSGDVRPEGVQLDIEGAGLLRLNIEHDRDLDAVDFRFGVPLTYGNRVYQGKFGY